MQKIALFGGTFDPIHDGHTSLIKNALSTFSLDHCYVIPCKKSPHKKNGPTGSDQERYEMCKLALTNEPQVTVSPIELERNVTPSYSWMTVKHYKEQFPDAVLYWILGTDQWKVIETWSRFDYLKEHLIFLVAERQEKAQQKPDISAHTLPFNSPLSSTKIREALLSGRLPLGVNTHVLRYIQENQLYKATI